MEEINKKHTDEHEAHDHDHLDDSPTTVTLEDENGESFEFEIIKTFEVAKEMYAALVPFNENEVDLDDDDASELVLLKFAYEEEEEFLVVIEDDDEYDRVLEGLMENLPDDYDIEVEK